MSKKIIAPVILLSFIIAAMTIFISCGGEEDNEEATLDLMQRRLKAAGYTVLNDFDEIEESNRTEAKITGGFSFIYMGAHGETRIPVLEFESKAAADIYAESLKVFEDMHPITNGKFFTITEAHHGTPHEDEKKFLENLIRGKAIK